MTDIQNSLFETIKVFTDSSIANSTAAITIQGALVSEENDVPGHYKLDYRGNIIDVYANANDSYKVGDYVYALVPDGDFNQTKTIIGLVNPSIDIYTNTGEENTEYIDVSDNFITKILGNNGVIDLISYKTIKETTSIFETKEDEEDFKEDFPTYLEDFDTYCLSMEVLTNLDTEQQVNGNYGISLQLPLINTDGESIYKIITIDTGNILGNPYRIEKWTEQKIYFTLDTTYAYDTEKNPILSYFCYDFLQDPTIDKPDIWLKNISFTAVVPVNAAGNGYDLKIRAKKGSHGFTFTKAHKTETKTLIPELTLRNKKISIDNTDIYWFIEDASINIHSKEYNIYGGYGWRCLNNKIGINMTKDGAEIYDYNTNLKECIFKRDEIPKSAEIKCVIIIKNLITISAQCTLKNLTATHRVFIEPTIEKAEYIKDLGYAHFIVTTYLKDITNIDDNTTTFMYNFARYDKNFNYIKDDISPFEIVSYNKLVHKKVGAKITRWCYETEIRIPVNKIEEMNTIVCSVFYIYLNTNNELVEEFIGTAKVIAKILNNANCTLQIEGDNTTISYDKNGYIFTDNGSIKTLTYHIYKSNGIEFTDDEYAVVSNIWTIPYNSIFQVKSEYSETDENSMISTVKDLQINFIDGLNDENRNDEITLNVFFTDKSLSAKTKFNFTQSDSDSNLLDKYQVEFKYDNIKYGELGVDNVPRVFQCIINKNNTEHPIYYFDYDSREYLNRTNTNTKINFWNNENFTGDAEKKYKYSPYDIEETNPCTNIYKDSRNSYFSPKVYFGKMIDMSIELRYDEESKNLIYKLPYHPDNYTFESIDIHLAIKPKSSNNIHILDDSDGFSEINWAMMDGEEHTYYLPQLVEGTYLAKIFMYDNFNEVFMSDEIEFIIKKEEPKHKEWVEIAIMGGEGILKKLTSADVNLYNISTSTGFNEPSLRYTIQSNALTDTSSFRGSEGYAVEVLPNTKYKLEFEYYTTKDFTPNGKDNTTAESIYIRGVDGSKLTRPELMNYLAKVPLSNITATSYESYSIEYTTPADLSCTQQQLLFDLCYISKNTSSFTMYFRNVKLYVEQEV